MCDACVGFGVCKCMCVVCVRWLCGGGGVVNVGCDMCGCVVSMVCVSVGVNVCADVCV